MGFFDDLSSGIGGLLGATGVGSILGMGGIGGMGKSNFQASNADLVNPVNQGQINTSMDQYAQLLPQQADLAGILRNQAMGQGVNPAQNMLNQATAQNVANQAALMSGQRGAGANAGLVARSAANQGANIQQQAAGQAATMGAQQQLAAMGQLQNQQALQQQGALNNQGQLLGAQANYNSSQATNIGNMNTTNAGAAAGNAERGGKMFGGLLSGAGAALPFLLNEGGQVPDHLGHVANCYYDGGKVPAMVSPGEKYVNPQDAKKVASGEKSLANAGQKIQGKAQVKGDSVKNDTVKKNLDAGGIVIPRSVMQSDDPVKAGTKFLIDAMKKHKGHEKDFKEALKKAAAGRKK